ncbi:MAG: hypothetical protein AB1498_12920 [bacterium]
MADTEQRLRDINEVSIAIDTWDDVFSDFDPRPLNERELSEDFISELKKRYRETQTGNIIISIYEPVSLKDSNAEKMVVHRIKRFFKHQYLQGLKDIGRIRMRGGIFVFLGISSLTILTLVTHYNILLTKLANEILGIALMPLGWFGIWEGFSKLVDTSPKVFQDNELFDKLSKAEFRFIYLENGTVKEENKITEKVEKI